MRNEVSHVDFCRTQIPVGHRRDRRREPANDVLCRRLRWQLRADDAQGNLSCFLRGGNVQAETAEILKINDFLARVGTDNSRRLPVKIWLHDIDRDLAGLDAAWANQIHADAMPTRATCQAKLGALTCAPKSSCLSYCRRLPKCLTKETMADDQDSYAMYCRRLRTGDCSNV